MEMTRGELADIAVAMGLAVSLNKRLLVSRINAKRAELAGEPYVQGPEMNHVNARVYN